MSSQNNTLSQNTADEPIPRDIGILRRKYADVMKNQAVTDVTHGIPQNSAPPFSVDKIIEYGKKYAPMMREIVQQVFRDTDEQSARQSS